MLVVLRCHNGSPPAATSDSYKAERHQSDPESVGVMCDYGGRVTDAHKAMNEMQLKDAQCLARRCTVPWPTSAAD